MFILDSDHLSILQYEEGAEFDRLTEMMRQHSPTDFFVTIVSFHEQVNGWAAYLNMKRSSVDVVRGYQ